MSLAESDCRVCGAGTLEELKEYASLPRVTSDCKPVPPGGRIAACRTCGAVQKPTDVRWRRETASIYSDYQPYFQSGGVEQAVFDAAAGVPRRRSMVLLDRLAATRSLGPVGSILDVGCGNGVLLSAFAEVRPRWRLFGHELSDLHAGALSGIPGFERLYAGSLADLPIGFDVITMIHALEHFVDPLGALQDLRPKLSDGGTLFIEVPNGEATPFDLVIADHVSHFSRRDLAHLLGRAGYCAPVIADDWVTKELSVVAMPGRSTVPFPAPTAPVDVLRRLRAQLRWLDAVVVGAREVTRKGAPVGLFGTSVAAMWLFGQLGDDIAFFVDEDPSRQDTTLFDRPVLRPSEAPRGATVYIALIPHVARAIAKRLARPGVEFSMPPEIPELAETPSLA
jgi:SAM-dependent methyltransferase